jgi:hypothetical protein
MRWVGRLMSKGPQRLGDKHARDSTGDDMRQLAAVRPDNPARDVDRASSRVSIRACPGDGAGAW